MIIETLNQSIIQLTALSPQIAQRQPEAVAQLNQVYQQLFGETIRQGCGNCYQKAFFRIQKFIYLNQNPTMETPITSRAYILKPDRGIQNGFGGDTLTNDNLTDHTAEKLLKANPALAKHFDKYPDSLFAEQPESEKKSDESKLTQAM